VKSGSNSGSDSSSGRQPSSRQSIRARRNVTFFFGGRTSTKIGPGRAQKGYYVRWSLLRQWRDARHSMPPFTPLSSLHALHKELLIIDSSRPYPKEWPTLPPCGNATLASAGGMVSAGGTSAAASAAPAIEGSPDLSRGRQPPHSDRSCLHRCSEWDARATSGACLGHYSPSLLTRSRFALCLRGDIPSSPRPYDALRYGAIPLLVSDHVWRVGMPFQCWVPWRQMTQSIGEDAFMRNAGGALHNVTASLTPAAEERMRELIAHFRRDVLWRHPRSRVADNLLMAAHRWRNRGEPLRGCCPLSDEIVE